jgi:hypothetical protein
MATGPSISNSVPTPAATRQLSDEGSRDTTSVPANDPAGSISRFATAIALARRELDAATADDAEAQSKYDGAVTAALAQAGALAGLDAAKRFVEAIRGASDVPVRFKAINPKGIPQEGDNAAIEARWEECQKGADLGYNNYMFVQPLGEVNPLANIIEIYDDECHRSCEEDVCDCSIEVKYRTPPFGPLRMRHELDGDGKPFKPDMRPIRVGRSDRADLRAARKAVAARKKRTKH